MLNWSFILIKALLPVSLTSTKSICISYLFLVNCGTVFVASFSSFVEIHPCEGLAVCVSPAEGPWQRVLGRAPGGSAPGEARAASRGRFCRRAQFSASEEP